MSAICEVKEKVQISVCRSVEGTWQRGVFSSLDDVGVVVSITNFEVVDVEIMLRYCTPKEELRKSDKITFDKWKIDHNASSKANYEGSAGSKEAASATKSFQQSVEKR